MKIYGLSGKSGTGKSYNASELCYRLNIPAIIDDGLFIYGSSIAAGVSAKKQETRIGAVKTALFMDNDHCAQVRAAIRRTKPSAILILGTSDDMVEKIADRLGLPEPSRIIHIDAVDLAHQRAPGIFHRMLGLELIFQICGMEPGKHVDFIFQE